MVLHNPNNWHWVNKDAAPWARQYIEDNIRTISVEGDGVTAKIDKLTNMDGDVDVSQRKGKVITIFDVKLTIEYSGKTKDNEEVSGTISVPEVAHDTEEHEYVFDIDISTNSASKAPVRDLVKSKIIPLLRKEFIKLGPALIAEHGKDIQHSTGPSPSNPNAPIPKQQEAISAPSTAYTRTDNTLTVNTTTVTDYEEFRAPAIELYRTFVDPQRIAAFTRAPPKLFEGAVVGGKFELFGGNVAGQYTELLEPTKIVQKWRLDTWPKGHFSHLEIVFDQNDVDNVTVMKVTWSGVPRGQEEVTRKNWKEYYVRSIKQTFGFGAIL